MPEDNGAKPLANAELEGPAREFVAYCESELERLKSAGEVFDKAIFDDAVALVLQKLGVRQRDSAS